MRRINQSQDRDQIAYHVNRNDAPVFEDSHAFRVKSARDYVAKALFDLGRRGTILELGCGSGDISGPFSGQHDVFGVDVVEAAMVAKDRWPDMQVIIRPIELLNTRVVAPDVLVLCEVLEHLDDPWPVVTTWAANSKYMVIGHPIDDEDGLEPGHSWSFSLEDFQDWFRLSGYELREHVMFGMGPFPKMACGWGVKV